MLLHDWLLHAERFDGRRPALIDGPVRRTYAETALRVRRAAAGLAARGLAPGARVAVAAENCAFYYEAYFACSFAGLAVVPLNIRLSPAETAFILSDADCAAVLHDEACAPLLAAESARLCLSTSDWEGLIAASEPAEPVTGNEHGLAHLCYTGGTTGRPKGVMLSHRNVAASATNKIVLGQFRRDDVWLHAAPMFHQADSWACFSFTALGAQHVFLPRFDAGRALDLIQAHGCTGTQVVPTMILLTLDAAEARPRDLASIRRVLYGSAPMPVAMLQRAQAAFGPVFQHIYGLTEAAGTVAATPWPAGMAESAGERLASCGQPIPGVAMRIAGLDGGELPPGEVGPIQVKGANVSAGYWQRPGENAVTFRDGWLETGDLGRFDADGWLFIADRTKDMIITGGENVYSTEVENVLHACPGVREAAAIGLPHPKWGEAVTAVVTPSAPIALTAETIIAHCRAHLAAYKCPKAVIFMDAMPKSAAGKILKADLRAALATGSNASSVHRSEPAG